MATDIDERTAGVLETTEETAARRAAANAPDDGTIRVTLADRVRFAIEELEVASAMRPATVTIRYGHARRIVETLVDVADALEKRET